MTIGTLTTTLAKEIVLGDGTYATVLTVAAAGRINAPAPDTSFQAASGIYANVSNGSIANFGVITGAIPAVNSYTAPAVLSVNPLNLSNSGTIIGQSGVYLQNGGTVTNFGSIAGLEAAGKGGYGVRLVSAALINAATIYGQQYGAAEFNTGEINNTGRIMGETVGVKLASGYLTKGGTLLNSGTITGVAVAITETSALIVNSGTIGGGSYGIRSNWGGSIANSGQISGGVDGVLLLNAQYQPKYATSLSNTGTIRGGMYALALNGANVSNGAQGLISGSTIGVGVGDGGYFLNSGSVYGVYNGLLTESGGRAGNAGTIDANKIGDWLFADSVMTNSATGTIGSAGTGAVDQAAYLVNAGRIGGNIYGAEALSGGIVINSGSIASAQRDGVYLSAQSLTSSPDFLVNSGYIYGTQLGAWLRNGTAYNYGIIDAGQVAVSLVTGTSFINHAIVYGSRYGLQLQGGSAVNAGTIGGHVNGVVLTRGTFTNAGTVGGGKYAVYGTAFALGVDPGAVFNGNVLDKSKSSILNLAGDTPGTLMGIGTQFNGFATVDFEPGAHWLISGNLAGLANHQVINGFEQGDTIVLSGFSATSESFVSGVGLKFFNSVSSTTLDITGSFALANFSIATSGTVATVSLRPGAPCFAAGTRILTPAGETPVEALRVGDKVIAQDGEDMEILWIGRRTIDLVAHPDPDRARPIRISAGALEEDMPTRDLTVSPDHAMLIDGLLVPAQLLLNHQNIIRDDPAAITYFHVELTRHAIIFANGAPSESYLETGNRAAFENCGAAPTLDPDFSAALRRRESCAELLLEGERLETIRRRIQARHRWRRSLGV